MCDKWAVEKRVINACPLCYSRVQVIKAPFGIIIPPSSYICVRVWCRPSVRAENRAERETKVFCSPNPRKKTNIFKTPLCNVELYQDKLSK